MANIINAHNNTSIQIKPISLSQISELKEMLIDCAYELWNPNTSRAEFALTLNKNNEYEDLDDIQASYLNNKGCFFILLDNEKVVGSGAIRKFDNTICELKRMWFLPSYRGRGLGFKMAQQLFEYAKQQGYTKMRLDVYRPDLQFKAMALYRKLGFYEIDPYNNHPAQIWMEKEL